MITTDSLVNLYSGLGTLKDKTTHAQHVFTPQIKEGFEKRSGLRFVLSEPLLDGDHGGLHT